jgi:hypothetical protein
MGPSEKDSIWKTDPNLKFVSFITARNLAGRQRKVKTALQEELLFSPNSCRSRCPFNASTYKPCSGTTL